MAKKKVSGKPEKQRFVVLDENFDSCCGQEFETHEKALEEAKEHFSANCGFSNPIVYYVARLVTKLSEPEEIPAIVEAL